MLATSGRGKEAVPGYDRQYEEGKGDQKIKLEICIYISNFYVICIGSESGNSCESANVDVLPTREDVLIIDEVKVMSEVILM